MYQIILKNGLIWDSATSSAIQKDLSIENGKIACIGPIHENEQTIGRLTNVIDVSGAMVLPGLIDMHTHIYPRCLWYFRRSVLFFLWGNCCS